MTFCANLGATGIFLRGRKFEAAFVETLVSGVRRITIAAGLEHAPQAIMSPQSTFAT